MIKGIEKASYASRFNINNLSIFASKITKDWWKQEESLLRSEYQLTEARGKLKFIHGTSLYCGWISFGKNSPSKIGPNGRFVPDFGLIYFRNFYHILYSTLYKAGFQNDGLLHFDWWVRWRNFEISLKWKTERYWSGLFGSRKYTKFTGKIPVSNKGSKSSNVERNTGLNQKTYVDPDSLIWLNYLGWLCTEILPNSSTSCPHSNI